MPAAGSYCHLPLQDEQHCQHDETNEICLFLDTSTVLSGRIAGYITLFFKLYDPTQLKLSFVGHFQVGSVGMLVLTASQAGGIPEMPPAAQLSYRGPLRPWWPP